MPGSDGLGEKPDHFFPYEKYGITYGFSKNHLKQRDTYSALQLCIFDRLELLGEFRQKVQQLSGRDVYVIHLSAPEEDLRKRQESRSPMEAREKQLRTEEMVRDLARFRIGLGRCRRHIDLVIQNGNNTSVNTAVRKAVECITAHIADTRMKA